MRKLIFLFLCVSCWASAQTMTHAFWVLPNYTNATEATLATSLSGKPSYSTIIFNTDLSKIRCWNGTVFADAPPIVVNSLPTIPSTGISGLGSLATQSGNFSGTSSGTNTGDQTLPTAATLTGTTLNATIVNSSLTSVGTLASGTVPTTLLSGTVTNAQLAGSIDLTTKVTGTLPFANNAGTSATTSATTGTMTVNMNTRVITITPSGACTFNGSGGVTGQTSTFVITTSGVSSFVLTWGTNYKTTATLATGTTTAKMFTVEFLCTNGTQWIETSRTTAQ